MKLAVLTVGDPIDAYVLQELERQHPVDLTIKFVENPPDRKNELKKVTRKAIRGIYHAINSWFYNRLETRLAEYSEKQLRPKAIDADLIINAQDVNSQRVIDELKTHDIDYLILLGSPILRKQVVNAPKSGTINLHYGVSPKYRGGYTLFWPLFFRDPDGLGLTIHWVDEGVDTGSVLCCVYPKVGHSVDEFTLTLDCAKLAAKALPEILSTRPKKPCSTNSSKVADGRNYRYADRTIFHDIAYQLRRIVRPKWPERPARIRFESR